MRNPSTSGMTTSSSRNPEGRPIDVKVFTQWTWNPALRRLNLRPRKFYATRHTFISVALTRGWNLKALAEYCGTSVAMIERERRGRDSNPR
jgi:integrase